VRAVRGLALCVIVAACGKEAPPADRDRARPGPPPRAAADPSRVPFDCTGFVPASGSSCATRPVIAPGALALVGGASHLLEWEADSRPSEDRWSVLQAAVDAAAALRSDTLSIEQRVVVQNAALRIAIYATQDHRPALVRAALAVVDRLAVPARALAGLGETPQLEAWLGPGPKWRLRDRTNRFTLHGTLNQQVKYFRPVLAGTRRAVFSQLVAIDTDGLPHLTPIVGELEMRAGDDPGSAACVAEVELAELACHPPGLVVPDLMTHPQTHFFRRGAGTDVACNGCHDATTFPVVPETEAPAQLATEMKALLAKATQALGEARAAAR
jgi:hypothetical protein